MCIRDRGVPVFYLADSREKSPLYLPMQGGFQINPIANLHIPYWGRSTSGNHRPDAHPKIVGKYSWPEYSGAVHFAGSWRHRIAGYPGS